MSEPPDAQRWRPYRNDKSTIPSSNPRAITIPFGFWSSGPGYADSLAVSDCALARDLAVCQFVLRRLVQVLAVTWVWAFPCKRSCT